MWLLRFVTLHPTLLLQHSVLCHNELLAIINECSFLWLVNRLTTKHETPAVMWLARLCPEMFIDILHGHGLELVYYELWYPDHYEQTLCFRDTKVSVIGFLALPQSALGVIGNIAYPLSKNKGKFISPPSLRTSSPGVRQ